MDPLNTESITFTCAQCKKPVDVAEFYHRPHEGKFVVILEYHGGLTWVEVPETEFMTDEQFEKAKNKPKTKEVFAASDFDVFRQIRAVCRFCNFKAAAVRVPRLMKMEEAQLTAEMKKQGFDEGFNLGIACEIHPYLDVRILYQDGAWEDTKYIDPHQNMARILRDIMYREKVSSIKYGDRSTWPGRVQNYFPKPKIEFPPELLAK